MSVGITYTGTDGRTTSFRSNSADDAMLRLSRIRGYRATDADGISASLAGGWRERHKARAKKYTGTSLLAGQIGGAKYATRDGIASGLKRVSDIDVVDGKLVKTIRNEFVSSGGNVVSVGNKRTSTLLDLSSLGSEKTKLSDRHSTAKSVGSSVWTESRNPTDVNYSERYNADITSESDINYNSNKNRTVNSQTNISSWKNSDSGGNSGGGIGGNSGGGSSGGNSGGNSGGGPAGGNSGG